MLQQVHVAERSVDDQMRLGTELVQALLHPNDI
jgi:hypothetical protein